MIASVALGGCGSSSSDKPLPTATPDPHAFVTFLDLTPVATAIAPGTKVALHASPLNGFNQVVATEKVRWTTSDPSVAAVDTTGMVTAKSEGAATITATVGSGTSQGTVRTANIVVSSLVPYDVKKGIGPLTVIPVDTPGFTVTAADMNARGTVIGTLKPAAGSSVAFRWSNGSFQTLSPAGATVVAINDSGAIAGHASGQPVIWLPGATDPVRLFATDTALVVKGMNNRGEVLLTSAAGSVYVWYQGQAKRAGQVDVLTGINNNETIVGQSRQNGYSYLTSFASPFGTRTQIGSRLQGQTCGGGGRNSTPAALNDSDEVLIGSEEILPGVVHALWRGLSGGCMDLTGMFPDMDFHAFNGHGLLGGSRTFSGFQTAVLALNYATARVDDLLADNATTPTWHIADVTRIFDSRLILARGIRLSDGKPMPVILRP